MFQLRGYSAGYERAMLWVLQQNGQKVKGEVQGPDGGPVGSIEGTVNGEVFSWRLTGPFIRLPNGAAPTLTYSGEAKVNGDELSGTADGLVCPCSVLLRRVNTEANREKPQM
jgi:hypothetical protein